ncbi:MAG: hypothetical protein ACQEXJ_20010 [Myxococcota bacterium]
MLRRLIPITVTLVLLSALLAGACGDVEVAEEAPACRSAEDCVEGRACAFGHCVVEGTSSLEVQARILPPPGSGLLQQQVPLVRMSEGPALQITLVEPAALHGVVRHAGDAFGTNVPGVLEARTPGDIPGQDYRFTTHSLEGLDAQGRGYELRLLPRRTYEVTFRPEPRETPPHTFTLGPEEVVDGRFDVELPAASEYVPLEGFVRFETYEPIGGARVVVGLPDGRALPALTTDSVKGAFSTRLPPGTDEVKLRVEAAEDGPIFPDRETGWVEPDEDLAVTVPSLPAGVEEFQGRVRVLTPGGAPASGLSLALVGHLEGGTLRRSAVTDEDGIARFRALPGAWEVLVSVPPGQTFATRIRKLNLAADVDDDEPSTITLDPRPRLAGVVRDVDGEPVRSGNVRATRRVEGEPGDTLVIAPAPFREVLDEEGRFAIRVDPGTYDVRVLPDTTTGAPPRLLRGEEVAQDTDLSVSLGEPDLAHLTVAAPDGTFLPDVTVELYLPDASDGDREPTLLTKGTTGEEGFVDLLLPFLP